MTDDHPRHLEWDTPWLQVCCCILPDLTRAQLQLTCVMMRDSPGLQVWRPGNHILLQRWLRMVHTTTWSWLRLRCFLRYWICLAEEEVEWWGWRECRAWTVSSEPESFHFRFQLSYQPWLSSGAGSFVYCCPPGCPCLTRRGCWRRRLSSGGILMMLTGQDPDQLPSDWICCHTPPHCAPVRHQGARWGGQGWCSLTRRASSGWRRTCGDWGRWHHTVTDCWRSDYQLLLLHHSWAAIK